MTPFLLIWLIIWSQLDIKAKSIDFNLGFPLKESQHLDQIKISDQWWTPIMPHRIEFGEFGYQSDSIQYSQCYKDLEFIAMKVREF